MEFYESKYSPFEVSQRFNSQRDGILRDGTEFGVSYDMFQFPTGWNSTAFSLIASSFLRVSIPNGMEFYFALLGKT